MQDYARLEAGKVEYWLAEAPLTGILSTCESLIYPQLRKRRLTLRSATCAPDLAVYADVEKLEKVILNLL